MWRFWFLLPLLLLLVLLKCENAQDLEIIEEEYSSEIEAKHVPPRKYDDAGYSGRVEDTPEITSAELDGLASLLRDQHKSRKNLSGAEESTPMEEEPSALTDEEVEDDHNNNDNTAMTDKEVTETPWGEQLDANDIDDYSSTIDGTEMDRLIASNAGAWELIKAQIKQDLAPLRVIADKLGLTSQMQGVLESLKRVFIGICGPLIIVGLRIIEKVALSIAKTSGKAQAALKMNDESRVDVQTTTAKYSGK